MLMQKLLLCVPSCRHMKVEPFKYLETLFEMFASAGGGFRQLFLKGPGSYITNNVLSAAGSNNLSMQNITH